MSTFITEGVCSSKVSFEITGGVLKNVRFNGGCQGNLQGICNLVEGMPVQEVVKRLKGIECGSKQTSCPDQLAKALEEAMDKEGA